MRLGCRRIGQPDFTLRGSVVELAARGLKVSSPFELSGSVMQLTGADAARLCQVFRLRLAPTFNLVRILGRFGFLPQRSRIKSPVDQ
jgi:hypothetical protein